MNLCCLTEEQVLNIIENIYELCDCCEDDIYDDTLFDSLDIEGLEDLYD